mgnify:CR=1 FL=1|tara:strand:+ start:723 stop:1091 length:369 start_codon:yes stop_codon:yes gene_type:complete
MLTRAITKGVRISTLKARLVANLIRGMHVSKAIDILEHSPKKAAKLMLKTLLSAIANAENNHDMDIDDLKVQYVYVDQGPVMKRMMPRARGRGDRILKPSSHLTVIVGDGSSTIETVKTGDN